MNKLTPQKLKRLFKAFLALPFVVMVALIGIYFLFWRTDPLIRFTHMLWTLCFWMTGTLAGFAFVIPARVRPGAPIHLLVIAAATIALAVYFTPLSRFACLFSAQTNLALPAAIGGLTLITIWLIAVRLRNQTLKSQTHRKENP